MIQRSTLLTQTKCQNFHNFSLHIGNGKSLDEQNNLFKK